MAEAVDIAVKKYKWNIISFDQVKYFHVSGLFRDRDQDTLHPHGHECFKILLFYFLIFTGNGQDDVIALRGGIVDDSVGCQ